MNSGTKPHLVQNKDFCLGELYKKLFGELTDDLLKNDEVNINETLIPFVLKVGKIIKSQYYTSIKFDDSKNLPLSINHNYKYLMEKFNESQKESNGLNNDEMENNNNKKIDEGFNLIISWNSRLENQLKEIMQKSEELNSTDESNSAHINIYDCFEQLTKPERLDEQNEWYCPKCKQFQRANKKIDIYKTPNILIIQLKRFNNRRKIDTTVDFPINNLDISKYVISKNNDELKYDLFAIGNHFGSMGVGHYIAYCKNHFDNVWYEFNDSSVSTVNESHLISSSAYTLFYKRKGIEKIDFNKIYNKKFVNYENVNKEEETKMNVDDQSTKENEKRNVWLRYAGIAASVIFVLFKLFADVLSVIIILIYMAIEDFQMTLVILALAGICFLVIFVCWKMRVVIVRSCLPTAWE